MSEIVTTPKVQILKKHRPDGRHWASDFIGMKWVNGGRGPHFDCWGLVHHVYHHIHGTTVPLYAGVDATDPNKVAEAFVSGIESPDWLKIETPVDGCTVAMGLFGKVTHVGIYIDAPPGHVLHCLTKKGVICQRLDTVGNYSLQIIGYYIPKSWKQHS